MNKLPVSQYWINFKKNDLLMVCIDRFVFLKIIGIRQFKKRMLPLFLLFIGHISIHSAEVQWRSGYEIYLPTVTVQRVFTGQSHDASIVYFDGKWFALWDSGTEQEGQVIWQSTSTDLVTWSPPIQAFSSPEGSVEPIIASTSTKLQWQPSLVVVGNELWCLWYATIKGLYFSKLLSSGDKWSSQLILARNGITIDNKKWSPFVTNNGIQTNSGTVVFPITLMREQENKTFFNLEKRDSIVYTNDGIDWVVSPGVSYGPTGSQCWEAAIWEPNPGQLNLISRNNREGSLANPLIPQENLKFSMTSLSNSDAWVPETFVPVEAAMSRPHVMHKGNRNFLAQNDSHISHHTQANRKNLSLFFNRGKGYDFVAGLTLFPETNFTTAPYPLIDYPQMAIWGDKGVVSFSQKPDNSLRSDTWSINVAVVDPLPADNTRYLFPRSARGKIEQDTTGGHHWVRFFNNYSSAGIDIDENDVSSDNVLLRFKFKPETFHRQIIASFGYPAVALASENGRLFIGKTEEPSTFIDCGPIETNEFTEIDFESGLGKTSVKVNGGPTLYTINYSPGEGRAMYFGLSFYGGASETPGAQFVVDLNSVKTAVVKGLPPTVPVMNSASSGSTIGFSWNGSVTGSGDVVSGYEVDIWTNITSSFVSGWQTRDVGMMDSTSLAGLRGGAIYYARARAYDGAGNRSAWSDVKEQRVMGLVNLNFEDTFGEGIPGWGTSDESNVIVTNAEGEFHGGAQALKIRGVPGAMAWQDWGAYTDEATYQLTFFGKVVSAEGVKGRIAVMTLPPGGGNSQIISSVDVPDSDWRRYSMTFSTTTISDGIRIQASANTSRLQGTMYFDDFTIIRVSTPVVKPAAPTGVTVVPDRNTLQVTWVEPASSVVDNYKVCVSTKEDFLTNVVGWNNRDVGNQTTVEVRGLAAYTTYFVKVLAQNRKSGMSSYSSAATAQTLETDPPSTPTIESTSLINMVEFRWGESINIYDSGLAGYEVDISADSEFTVYLPGWHTSDVGTKTSVTLEGLRGGTTYYARARAYDGAGNRSAWSDVKEQRVMGLVNPDFEELSTEGIIPGWNQTIGPNVTITTTDGEFHGGSAGLKITATPGVGPPGLWMAWQDWTGYVPGATYQLTFWGKVDSTEGLRGRVPVLTIPPNDAHGLVFALVDVTSPEWTKYSMTFSTPTESNGIRLRCYESTTTLNGTMYFDDFSITTVTLPVGLPGAPTAVTVSPGESSLVVNWQAPVGSVVDSYRVFVSTQINFGSHVPGWSNKDVGNMTTAQVNGLEESRTYYVRVRAYNRMRGTSAYSVMSSGITLDTTPPISPVLSGTPNEHTMTLSWTESVDVGSGVAGYEVDVSTDAGFGSYLSGWEKKDVGVATTTVVSGLISNSTYFARARAYDTSGNISISGPTLSVKTLPKDPRLTITITAPAPNTILTMKQTVSIQAEAGSATEATKIWFTLDGVTVSTAITAPYSYEWFITGANNGAHTWQATVFDAMGNSSTTVPVPVTVNIDILPPSTPILQSPTELSTTSVRFSWSVATDNVGVTGYRLYRDTSLIATIGGEETSFLDSGLAPETLYKYTVAAFDDMGNTSAMSPELSVTTPRRALLAPRGSLSGVSPQSVGIRWASVEGANRYTLAASLSVTSGHEFSLQREIPASETSDNESISGLSPNTTYYLYLNACNEFDCTDFVPLGSAVTHALPPALTAAEGKGKEVRLTINANGNPAGTKYRIEMSRGGGEFTLATTATSLSPVMGDLTPGERYIFRVKAENHAGVATEPSNTLSATIAPETVEGARAYPVPFRPGIGAEGITFDQIPEGASVKIYTADGRPVKTLITNTEGSVLWDLTNDDGSPVSSGVFLALMEKNGGRKRLKVVVQK